MGPEARPVGICQVLSVSKIWTMSDSILLEREKRVAREREYKRWKDTQRNRHTETEAHRDTETVREEQSKTRTGL